MAPAGHIVNKRDYERLTIEEFGKHLLRHNDLDPIYVALYKCHNEIPAAWSMGKLQRWMLAYWCFYHAGVACYMSDKTNEDFWPAMMEAAKNETLSPAAISDDLAHVKNRWPRGSERRHFRGRQGVAAVQELTRRYPVPTDLVGFVMGNMASDTPQLFREVSGRAQMLRGFGPWIAFKICDMADRVLGIPINVDNAAVFMFKDPVKAALMVWRDKAGLPETAKPKRELEAINFVVDYLTDYFKEFKAPPSGNRQVGLFEVETVLCKYKSHLNGHYPLYNDVDEINEGLLQWSGSSESAKTFYGAMPKNPEKE